MHAPLQRLVGCAVAGVWLEWRSVRHGVAPGDQDFCSVAIGHHDAVSGRYRYASETEKGSPIFLGSRRNGFKERADAAQSNGSCRGKTAAEKAASRHTRLDDLVKGPVVGRVADYILIVHSYLLVAESSRSCIRASLQLYDEPMKCR